MKRQPKAQPDSKPYSHYKEIVEAHWPEGAKYKHAMYIALTGSDEPKEDWTTPEGTNDAIDDLMATTFIPDLQVWEIPHRFFATPFGEIVLRAFLRANEREWISIKDARVILDTNSFTAVKSLVHTGTIRCVPNPWPPAWHKTSILVNREDTVEAARRKLKKQREAKK